MRKTKMLKIALAVLTACTLLSAGVFAAGTEPEAQDNNEPKPFTVMLDAGHGGNDPGAIRTVDGVEYNERAFNDKLMNACYERLIQYDSVFVYRTRVANNHISTYARSTFAHNVDADLFLSFHINSSSYKSAHGASTIIPCGNYRKNLKNETADLTEKILSRLSALGLKNNGFMTRVLEDAPYLNYPDGSAGDYYEVIRQGVKYDIPSMILETAFITSDTDLALLKDDNKIKEIGAAVADAIAAKYDLKITGHTLPQPVQTAQTSGVSLGTVPKTLKPGDIVPLTASGGSGEGEYIYLASNPYIARVEGNNLIVTGAGDFRVTVTRYEGVTETPRSAGNTNVTSNAISTSVDASLEKIDYFPAENVYKATVKVRLKDQIDGIVPRGEAGVSLTGPSGAIKSDISGTFGDDGNCVIEMDLSAPGEYNAAVNYSKALYDAYDVSGAASLVISADPRSAATLTPEPTPEPTAAPTDEPSPEATDPAPVTSAAEPSGAATDNNNYEDGNASVSFGLLEILVVVLIAAIVVTIILIIRLAFRKRRR